jgi:dihydrofolate synthase/folylpolyglutamate synthase
VWSGVDPDTPPGAVIRAIAEEREAPFAHVPAPREVRCGPAGVWWGELLLPALGRHQAHNAALAAAACADLPEAAIRHGLTRASHPGCCERRGDVIVDGAHNLSSIRATVAMLRDHFPGRTPELVFALQQDKDLDAIAPALAPRVRGVTCTRVDERRGRDARALAAHPAWGGRAVAVPDAVAALDRARAAAGEGGLVLVTGSLYLAGALRRYA